MTKLKLIKSFIQQQRQRQFVPASAEIAQSSIKPTARPKKAPIDRVWGFETADRPKPVAPEFWNPVWHDHRDRVLGEVATRLFAKAERPSKVAPEVSARLFDEDALKPETIIGRLYAVIVTGTGKSPEAALDWTRKSLRRAREAHAVLTSDASELQRFVAAVMPTGDAASRSTLHAIVSRIAWMESVHREANLVPDEDITD